MDAAAHTPWTRVAEIAGPQWSQITVAQLRAAGVSRDRQRRAVQRGLLFPSFQCVFSVGRPIATPRERAMAAVLACGPGALLSHDWALWNYDLGRLPDHPPDVSAPPTRHDREGIRVHRTRHLAPDRNHGIPTTTPNRTIIDVAPGLGEQRLRRVVNQAQILRLTTAESLREETLRMRGVPTAALLGVLPEDQRGATRSLLEDLLLELHRERGLPLPAVNAIVHGRERDFSYPGLVVEADGWEAHGTRIAFEDDHETRLDLEAEDTRVVAVTYRQVTRGRDRTADRLERIVRRALATSR